MTAERLITDAAARGLTLAVAESLTGGMLAAELVSVPGASRVLLGGIVAYNTELKHRLLGVDPELLARRGPVDAEVARQMARGVRNACGVNGPSDLGIATTGVAGPDPDPQTGQPVGTVWVAVASAQGDLVEPLDISGDLGDLRREEIRSRTVKFATELALRALSSKT